MGFLTIRLDRSDNLWKLFSFGNRVSFPTFETFEGIYLRLLGMGYYPSMISIEIPPEPEPEPPSEPDPETPAEETP